MCKVRPYTIPTVHNANHGLIISDPPPKSSLQLCFIYILGYMVMNLISSDLDLTILISLVLTDTLTDKHKLLSSPEPLLTTIQYAPYQLETNIFKICKFVVAVSKKLDEYPIHSSHQRQTFKIYFASFKNLGVWIFSLGIKPDKTNRVTNDT